MRACKSVILERIDCVCAAFSHNIPCGAARIV